ncbi:MAG TPA: homoserine kinase, partial [Acidiferrobacteraceae bacterium]|nr:homoserine kinase [Acidiferrobacteraceae bacterium]
LEHFLQDYAVGTLRDLQGIAAGIENTNYFVWTDQAQLVLTVFEKLPETELPFFLDLKAYLARHGFACAEPIARRDHGYIGHLHGKPAALVRRLFGASVHEPTPHHCREVGQTLGRLHTLGQEFPGRRDNDRGPHWWRQTATALHGRLSADDDATLRAELRFQSLYRFADLPRGLIHADLFRDNALFQQDALSGVIDFYYACTDVLLFDVAIAVNDWCVAGDGTLSWPHAEALVAGYRSIRAPTPIEHGAWPVLLRAAALRFWLSRLYDLHFPRAGEITHTKDPAVFGRILRARQQEAPRLRALWQA